MLSGNSTLCCVLAIVLLRCYMYSCKTINTKYFRFKDEMTRYMYEFKERKFKMLRSFYLESLYSLENLSGLTKQFFRWLVKCGGEVSPVQFCLAQCTTHDGMFLQQWLIMLADLIFNLGTRLT